MVQTARNLTDAVDGFLLGKTQLILDRDPNFTRDFRAMLRQRGVDAVRLPSRSPNLNAFAERLGGLLTTTSEKRRERSPTGRTVRCEMMNDNHAAARSSMETVRDLLPRNDSNL